MTFTTPPLLRPSRPQNAGPLWRCIVQVLTHLVQNMQRKATAYTVIFNVMSRGNAQLNVHYTNLVVVSLYTAKRRYITRLAVSFFTSLETESPKLIWSFWEHIIFIWARRMDKSSSLMLSDFFYSRLLTTLTVHLPIKFVSGEDLFRLFVNNCLCLCTATTNLRSPISSMATITT